MNSSAHRVLVVDDHKTNRLKLTIAIRNLGHQVEEAADGAAALVRLAAGGIDMVLLDIVMPEMDGFEVLRRMKADMALRDIPTLVISSLEDMADVVQAIELGADDFLTKSFDPVLLRARVNAGLERKRLRDQELEYLRQVDRLARASGMVQSKGFDPRRLGLDEISEREDALGNLSRVFVSMASAVYRREQTMRRTISLLRGAILLLSVGAMWGLVPALARIVMLDGQSPFGTVFWSLWASALTMLGIATVTGRFPKLGAGNVKSYFLIGLVGTALPQFLFFWVAGNLSAVVISLILAAESFIIFVVAAGLGLERPSLKRFLGLCLGLGSVLLVILPGSATAEVGSWVWVIAALLVPACYAGEGLLVAALPPSGDDAVATAAGVIWAAAIIMTPVALLSGSFIPIGVAIAGFGWAFALIGAVSAVSTVLLILAIRTTGAVFASQVGYATTAGGIIWSIVLLNEPMSPWVWAAIACMISGVVLVMPREKGEAEAG